MNLVQKLKNHEIASLKGREVRYECLACSRRGSKVLKLVDLVGIEPTTSSMPWKRAPSCATGPLLGTLLCDADDLIYSRRLHRDSQRRNPKPQEDTEGAEEI